ncbi:LOW QUALITY PROTEIN: T-cell differentiation antigen CD6 [Suncus etruscus]|uniref:LOW QUALITY PROTEIN: T-cell differentiation antigen CD6 n=1 Tax=Suncus etruscus TaxID=109475 RepID=UPI0021100FDC|nr:LOW QUALITY PROTEIN: T-cell differentiation antigen CD6 [Suncus etruscus]
MAAAMWLVSVTAGLLMATLSARSGPVTPALPGGSNGSFASRHPQDPGARTQSVNSLTPEQRLGVRLVEGINRCRGTVEVWRALSWTPVCGVSWNRIAAEAVCACWAVAGSGHWANSAGPALSSSSHRLVWQQAMPAEPPNARMKPWHRAIRCSSDEWQLCKVVEEPCGVDQRPAQVSCAETRALRLMDGSSPCAGRVEMLEHGRWGSICDDNWDLQDGHVVCGQLGCGWAIQALPGLYFPPGQGPIHRDLVNCSGDEAFLWDCPGLLGRNYCGHKEDAGVVCSEHQSWRLTQGVDSCEGQVEVHFRGVWNTVCDSVWYKPEATVLCRTLGCGNAVKIPPAQPHTLQGQMFYSCNGSEPALNHCNWHYNNSNLCIQSLAARVLCLRRRRMIGGAFQQGPGKLLNLTTSEAPTTAQPVTEISAVTVDTGSWTARELWLLLSCGMLGILLLCTIPAIAVLIYRGRETFPASVNHQHPSTSNQAGTNSYSEVPNSAPKEVPLLPVQAQAPPPADSDSDSDYEHYDFSSQPPVALSTFYNSQRHRFTEEEAQQNRFHLPPLEEDTLSLGPQCPIRHNSASSTSSGEGYCNSPRGGFPPWNPPPLSWSSPPNLELAGSQGMFSAGPSVDDSSSTSSGEEWYQNFKTSPQPPLGEQFAMSGFTSSQPEFTYNEDYDDIGAHLASPMAGYTPFWDSEVPSGAALWCWGSPGSPASSRDTMEVLEMEVGGKYPDPGSSPHGQLPFGRSSLLLPHPLEIPKGQL